MPPSSPPSLASAAYIDELYQQWRRDPESLPESWRYFFSGFDLSFCGRECVAATKAAAQSRVIALIDAWRRLGHLMADIDPLGVPRDLAQLDLSSLGFSEQDLDVVFDVGDLAGLASRAPLREILAHLRSCYGGAVGVEVSHISDPKVRGWVLREVELLRGRPACTAERRVEILERIVDAELFETFLHARYRGQKRFSLEGAETLIAALHALVELAPELGVEEIAMGMAHRGRLNVLANILDKSYPEIFAEFEGNSLPDSPWGEGDVKYHKGFSSDHVNHAGHAVHLSLTANPSHLEAVYPVVQGKARAKQRRRDDMVQRRKVLPLVIHGDAAFAGQGVVAETLNLSQLEGYRTGGTLHIVVNNQIGFTTRPDEARSSRYCTDVARMVDAPVFHVNGDEPEAACFVTELALRFRQEFGRDVVVDLVCYRRHGHNEGDEPEFTQPSLYRLIKDRPTVRRLYQQRLADEGVVDPAEIESRFTSALQARLETNFQQVHDAPAFFSFQDSFQGLWEGLDQPWSWAPVATGVSRERLEEVARALCTVPPDFELNPKVARSLPGRLAQIEGEPLSGDDPGKGQVDWGFAELLAFGTLLREGLPVRLSGQDSARGTFSHRHSVWRDMKSETPYVPLNHIHPEQAHLCVYNSALSEASVLGFDYGYSLVEPRMLILWEAQFGDFANGAQVVFDTFIRTARIRWGRASGLVMLLPHGYEGQGPDHSDAHLERYLSACADENLQVVVPSTPAQYFHVLRRQLHRDFRIPLVVMTPKSLLRHPACRSEVRELREGSFEEVLADPRSPTRARRVLLCSGKVYYDLIEARERGEVGEVAILRIEQLYPWPEARLRALVEPLRPEELVWVQEEPANRGAWNHVKDRIEAIFGLKPVYVGRPERASAASGSLRVHRQEQASIVSTALLGALPAQGK